MAVLSTPTPHPSPPGAAAAGTGAVSSLPPPATTTAPPAMELLRARQARILTQILTRPSTTITTVVTLGTGPPDSDPLSPGNSNGDGIIVPSGQGSGATRASGQLSGEAIGGILGAVAAVLFLAVLFWCYFSPVWLGARSRRGGGSRSSRGRSGSRRSYITSSSGGSGSSSGSGSSPSRSRSRRRRRRSPSSGSDVSMAERRMPGGRGFPFPGAGGIPPGRVPGPGGGGRPMGGGFPGGMPPFGGAGAPPGFAGGPPLARPPPGIPTGRPPGERPYVMTAHPQVRGGPDRRPF